MKKLIFTFICLFLVVPCWARVITVDDDGPADFNDIQAAINDANNGDTIIVADGTYIGTGNRNISFKGKAITVWSENGPASCIIDCEGQARGFFFNSGEDSNSVLAGLTITHANAPTDGNELDEGDNGPTGGGIYCKSSSPKIINCIISHNVAYDSIIIDPCHGVVFYFGKGGGIFCTDQSSPQILNCTFAFNKAGVSGGGIYCELDSNPIIAYCDINNNRTDYRSGGAIHCDYSSPMIANCKIIDNYARFKGGGVYGYYSDLSMIDCTIIDNVTPGGPGGGVGIEYGNPIIERCTIIGNGTKQGNNRGALYLEKCNAKVTNCLFTGNKSQWCIYIESAGNNIITNCTIVNNTHWAWGSAIHCRSNGFATVANCICRDNSYGGGEREIKGSSGGSVQVEYCNVEGGYTGEGNIDADPCFADPYNGDYHLKSEGWRWDTKFNPPRWGYDYVTSRCIDAGNPGSPLADELMSVPDDPCNIWGENIRINMGAYGGTAEASMPPYDWALLSDLTNDGIVNFGDFAGQANDWQEAESEQPGDLNRNSVVDLDDLDLFADDWLKQTSWHE